MPVKSAVTQNAIYAKWHRKNSNWGDTLNPFLINAISGMDVRYSSSIFQLKYLVIGSMMARTDWNTIVWGTGAIRSTLPFLHKRPKHICAVRGPLTRSLLLSRGISAPEIFGDPSLLLPRYYNPEVTVKYEYGIIPHFVDAHSPWLNVQRQNPDVTIIDILSDTHTFVQQVKACRYILSSSLHGIICADAYSIPAMSIEFSDNVAGDGFKFFDHFAAIKRTNVHRIRVTNNTTIKDIMRYYVPYTPDIDLDLLYAACPFRQDADESCSES